MKFFRRKKPQFPLDVFDIKEQVEKSGFHYFRGIKSNDPLELNLKGVRGRFLRLSLQTTTSFHLDEVEVIDASGVNVALNKKVICSSAFNGEEKYQGSGVVNGRKNGGCGFHTEREESPWLVIDLGSHYSIDLIRVFNREGEFFSRALSLRVEVSSDLRAWGLIHDNWKGLKELLSRDLNDQEKALVYAVALEHSKAVSLFNRLVSQGDATQAAAFQSLVNTVIKDHGLALGPHGFLKTFSFCSKTEKEKISRELQRILDWLNDDFGVAAFITSGTLLGMIRDSDFIPHDDDLDICYVGNARTDTEIVEERKALAKFLRDKGCGLQESNLAHYWCVSPGGVKLDIFSGFPEGDDCSINPLPRKGIKLEKVLPVKKAVYHGASLTLPADPEALLNLNYGKGWKEPDPFWKFNWSKAKKEYQFLYFGA